MTLQSLCFALLLVGAFGIQYSVSIIKPPEARELNRLLIPVRAITPTPTITTGNGGYDQNCIDKINNCRAFGKAVCSGSYAEWAHQNCPNYCGFCLGPSTPAPECKDKINNCDAFGVGVCSDKNYRAWALDNCRYFCSHHSQGFCSDAARQQQDSLSTTTTIAPEDCIDKVDCRLYEPQTCSETFKSWAKENCLFYCGYCPGKTTPPQLCIDRIKNCNTYDSSVCTDTKYRIWAEDNCRKTCGFCVGGTSPGTIAPAVNGKRSEDK